jgi:hypothetical protein
MRTPPKPQLQETLLCPEKEPAVPWEEIQRAISGVRFGTVQLIIQDGRVIQIDKTEKIRLSSS